MNLTRGSNRSVTFGTVCGIKLGLDVWIVNLERRQQ